MPKLLKPKAVIFFRPRPPVTEGRREEPAEVEDPDGCGPECRNLLHESDHRKEDSKCPHEGMVIDIYGYCRQNDFKVKTSTFFLIPMLFRYVHSHERRDWAWWESVRNYMYSMGNSW